MLAKFGSSVDIQVPIDVPMFVTMKLMVTSGRMLEVSEL